MIKVGAYVRIVGVPKLVGIVTEAKSQSNLRVCYVNTFHKDRIEAWDSRYLVPVCPHCWMHEYNHVNGKCLFASTRWFVV